MYSDSIYRKKDVSQRFQAIWQAIHQDLLLTVGAYGMLTLIALTFFAGWLAPYPPDHGYLSTPLLPPSWSDHGDIDYFLGTDSHGRDVLSRLLYGIRPTFGSAMIVTISVSFIGIFIGILAGISRGLRSAFLAHIFDIFLAIPTLLLAIIINVFLGPSLTNAMLAVSLALLPRMIRTVYTAVYDELEKEYVVAIRLEGASSWYILKDSILPNITPILIRGCCQLLSMAILDISALGFLGFGAQGHSPEWGVMLSEVLDVVYITPWMLILPGLAILTSVLLVHLLGDGIERAISARG